MAPTPAPTGQLKGSSTTMTGILAIIGGALGLFTHLWAAMHGAQLDPTTTVTAAGTVVAGVGLLKSADQNQAPTQK